MSIRRSTSPSCCIFHRVRCSIWKAEKYGFSALTLMFFLSVMKESEVETLLTDFRSLVDAENEKTVN